MKTITTEIPVNFHAIELKEQLAVMPLLAILQKALQTDSNLEINTTDDINKKHLIYFDEIKVIVNILKELGFILLFENESLKYTNESKFIIDTISPAKLDTVKILKNNLFIELYKAKEIIDSKMPFEINMKNYPDTDFKKLLNELQNVGVKCHIKLE